MKSEVMKFTCKWIELETIILSEVIWTQKDKYHMISFFCGC